MDVRSLQMMMQAQAMSVLSNRNAFTKQSPFFETAFNQMLESAMIRHSDNEQIDKTLSNAKVKYPYDKQLNQTNLTNDGKFDGIIEEQARTYDIDPSLIRDVIQAESNFNAHAKSHAGAKGLMQLMPATAKGLGVTDSYDPHQNIAGGTRYLRQMLDKFDGDLKLALSAYNAGPGNVDPNEGVPQIQETQNYVDKILTSYYT